jgi:transcriptional regulator with XRE-family HTH domain
MPKPTTTQLIRSALALRSRPQGALAGALGLSPASISARMNGHTEWTVRDLQLIGAFLSVEPATLLGDPTEDAALLEHPVDTDVAEVAP